MNVRINAAGGDDAVLACDRLGSRSDQNVDPGLDVRIAGLADAADTAIANAYIRLDDAPMVEDHGIGNDGVNSSVGAGCLPLPHAIADDLATAEFDLLAINRAVALDFDNQLGIGEPQAIADRRPEHGG